MTQDFEAEIAGLESAEDFLEYFQVDFDPTLVQSKHIPLLRLFHHILETFPTPWQHKEYKKALKIAYKQLVSGNELAFSASRCSGCSECDDD